MNINIGNLFRIGLLATAGLLGTMQQSLAQGNVKMIVGTGADPSLAQTYVAKLGGFFERNGLDVQLVQGASSAATVSMLIGDQINATVAAESAGISNHLVDAQIVNAGEVLAFKQFYGLVARNADSFASLKGKKIAVDNASNSMLLWNAIVKKFNLNPKDYQVIQVQPPEMVAALQRGDTDAFISWEPWLTRAVADIPNTKVLQTNDGVMEASCYVYLNRAWAEKNQKAAQAYMRAMVEATDLINNKPDEAVRLVATYLKMDPILTKSLMGKLEFKVKLGPETIKRVDSVAAQLKEAGRLKKDFASSNFFYADALKAVAPEKVTLK